MAEKPGLRKPTLADIETKIALEQVQVKLLDARGAADLSLARAAVEDALRILVPLIDTTQVRHEEPSELRILRGHGFRERCLDALQQLQDVELGALRDAAKELITVRKVDRGGGGLAVLNTSKGSRTASPSAAKRGRRRP